MGPLVREWHPGAAPTKETSIRDHITITHTPDDGTLATGDIHLQTAILKMCGWKWSRHLGAWYIPHSRDRGLDMFKITKTAAARQDALNAKAERLDEQSNAATWNAAATVAGRHHRRTDDYRIAG